MTGDPPLKPVSEYTVVGKSFPNSVTVSKVTAKETWVTDVRLPGMMHAPRRASENAWVETDFRWHSRQSSVSPTRNSLSKETWLGVVAPTEWEAIKAAQQVASGTKWTDWKGLPGDQPPVSIPQGRCGLEKPSPVNEQEFQR